MAKSARRQRARKGTGSITPRGEPFGHVGAADLDWAASVYSAPDPHLDHMPTARDGPLPALAADVEGVDGLDEHVPFVDELEHGKDAQPGDPEQRHRRRRA
jgi:hypothetical protein